MPTITKAEFTRLSLMAGTVVSLEQELLKPEEVTIWDRDFNMLCDDLARLVDPELAADLRNEKAFYDAANQVAKGYFDKKPFGGLKAGPGQYGFRIIHPQDLYDDAIGTTHAFHSWEQTLTISSAGKTYVTAAIGYGATNCFVKSLSNEKEVLGFHRLISYKPNPRILALEFNINGYPYLPYTVEPFVKIAKNDKLFKILPMPGRVLLHPGGFFYVTFWMDPQTGVSAPSGTPNFDVEVAPFGLVFGEYDFLRSSEWT